MTERFFFVHLQKTGGTALFQRLRHQFGQWGVYPTPDDQGGVESVINVDGLAARYAAHRDTIRVVTGHFPLCTVEKLGDPFIAFTILREPVERTLSILHRRRQIDERFEGMDLRTIYQHPDLQAIISNHMVKMLSMTPSEMTSVPLTAPVEFDERRLARAKHNLEHGIAVFGLQERFEDFCRELTCRFGWDLGQARTANRTRKDVAVEDDLRAQIAADNRWDVALYEYAKALG